MPNIKTDIIITKSILNNVTGEIKDEEFVLKRNKIDSAKGGWYMTYKDFDYILLSMKSPKEIKMLLTIRDLFKATLSIVVINKTVMCKKLDTTRATLSKFITRLIQYDFLMELEDKQYMLNPFMYLPYRSSSKELQDEWMEIRRDKRYNRRGFSNEEYRLIKDGKIKIELVKGSLVDEQRLLK
jgi:hypothetical protein